MGKILQQIELAVLDHGAQFRIDLPHLADLLENISPATGLAGRAEPQLAVDSRLGFLQHLLRQIACKNFQPPAGQTAEPISFKHMASE